MSWKSAYKSKLITLEEGVGHIKSGDHIVVGMAAAEPQGLMSLFHTVGDKVRDVIVSNCLNMREYKFITDPAMYGHFTNEGWFYTPTMRAVHALRTVSFVPNHLHCAISKRNGHRRPNIYMGTCTPPDKHGYVSLSLGVTYEREALEEADLVILEVNEQMPRTFGDTSVHVSQVDCLVENDLPLFELPEVSPSDKDLLIGGYIAELVTDGSTIQLGFGGIPNAVAQGLLLKKDLGVHTEMLTDAMVDLYEAGVITNKHKALYPGKMIGTFALGRKKLYDFIDDNPGVAMLRGSYVNDPYVIGQNSRMVSINTTLEVDLGGQCCSESIGHRQFSGTGGQADTAIGAQLSPEGKSIIALYSTAKGDSISKIVPTLTPGAVVSLSRNDVDYVVTEYGAAELRGTSIRERVKQLVGVAHPKFRAWLQEEADKMQIW